tara:strand:+ start:2504 stop:2734 length:231 start_codon:yes stop_codon:yes gene_type:complete
MKEFKLSEWEKVKGHWGANLILLGGLILAIICQGIPVLGGIIGALGAAGGVGGICMLPYSLYCLLRLLISGRQKEG